MIGYQNENRLISNDFLFVQLLSFKVPFKNNIILHFKENKFNSKASREKN